MIEITTTRHNPLVDPSLQVWGWEIPVYLFVGILLPLALLALEFSHRIRHTVAPALLVLAGGFALCWILVNAGQYSSGLQVAGF